MIFLNAWYKSCCLIIFPNIIRCSLVVFVTGLENWIESLYNAWSLGDTLPDVLFYNSIVVSERQKWTKSHKWYRIKYFKFKAIILTSYKLQQEFLGHWNFWVNEYSYNIYDNGTNQSSGRVIVFQCTKPTYFEDLSKKGWYGTFVFRSKVFFWSNYYYNHVGWYDRNTWRSMHLWS